MSSSHGSLFVLAGPSGAGKTTLSHHLVESFPEAVFSVSATTRKPRGSERDGIDYLFIDQEEFQRRVNAGFFLEHASVHGNLYGTDRQWVMDRLRSGSSVILDIDVQGALQVKRALPSSVLIFILPPDRDELVSRLQSRRTDDPQVVRRRMEAAAWESGWIGSFDYFVRNADLPSARIDVEAIYRGSRLQLDAMPFPHEVIQLDPERFSGLEHWRDRRVIVTSGPTREFIDDVRFISNRSSGLMGRSLAQAFRDAGSEVIFMTGPSCFQAPFGVDTVPVESAQEMLSGLLQVSPSADLLVMSAAVSDYRSSERTHGKLPRSGSMDIQLETTPDILVRLRESIPDLCPVMAFALEFGEGKRKRALAKLSRKGADAIFLNPGDVDGAGMESGSNQGELLFRDGSSIQINAASKRYVALLLAAAMGRYMKGKID